LLRAATLCAAYAALRYALPLRVASIVVHVVFLSLMPVFMRYFFFFTLLRCYDTHAITL